MLAEERFAIILDIIEKQGSATVSELMKALDASESTIRRDLSLLNKNGSVIKVHGGAVSKKQNITTRDENVSFRQTKNAEEKLTIAKYAAGLIEPKDFVYLDAGTTTEMMIEFLNTTEATFVTNAISHAKKIAAKGCRVYILGGEFKSTTEAIVGEEAVETLEKYNFTKGFWGTNGVTPENGFTTPEIKEAMVKKKSMEHCKECYVLADASKFEEISSIKFAEFDAATIITTEYHSQKKYKNVKEVE